jgi:hypothetical protein
MPGGRKRRQFFNLAMAGDQHMLTRVACILITGVLVTPTFTPARELLGAPIIAAGPGHLPFVGAVLWQQEAGTGTVSRVNVGWNQGWQCLGSDDNPENAANYPSIALIDQTQGREIGSVTVCEISSQPNSACWQPQSFTKLPEWRGPIKDGDLIQVVVIQTGQHCIGGSPWPVCSNGETCGAGMLYINALEKP